MKYNKLKGFFVEIGVTQQTLAELLKVDRTTFSNKINRYKGADFTVDEIRKLRVEYNVPIEFFLL